MFCKTCGSLLVPKKTEYGKWMSCPNGHSQPSLQQEAKTTTSQNIHQAKRIEVASDDNPLAVYDHVCKKCGHDKAELTEIWAAYADEDNRLLMKCGKCGHTEQLEGKVK